MEKQSISKDAFGQLHQQIREVLSQARGKAWQAVNSAMVTAYWNVGKIIVEHEQKGKKRAEYGKALIQELSKRLSAEFGKGFNPSNLWNIKASYLAYPKLHAVRGELT